MKLSLRLPRRMLLLLIPLALLLIALLGSRGPADALWLLAPGWSRARLVGNTRLQEAVPIALDDAGRIYLFIAPPDASPQIVALSRAAETLWTAPLDLPSAQINSPRLAWDGRAVVLLWLGDQHLYAVRVDSLGVIADPPAVLSGPIAVDSFALASDAHGRLAIWFGGSRQAPGLYALPTGYLGGPAVPIDQAGFQPVLHFDGAGGLHALWVRDNESDSRSTRVYYAAYPDGVARPEQSRLVTTIDGRRVGVDLEGPSFGLDSAYGYMIWKVIVRAGAFMQYAAFPLSDPARISEVRALGVPGSAALSYAAPPADGLQAGPRVPLAPNLAANSPGGLAISAGLDPELALVCEKQIEHKNRQSVNQVCAVFFRDGAPAGYQLLSFAPNGSFTPALTSDRTRYLYATWRQLQPPGFGVYVASTAPDMSQALAGLTGGDVARVTVDTVFGMLTGAIFAPLFALLWLIAPLIALGVTWFVRRGAEGFTHWGVLASLAVALAAYWIAKLTSFENHLGYVPFSEWVPIIPSWLALPLRIAVPALIAAGGLRIAWRYTYQVGRRSALLFVLIYAGVDALLTAAIYGGLLLDIFAPGLS
jgi:hypothetical protein